MTLYTYTIFSLVMNFTRLGSRLEQRGSQSGITYVQSPPPCDLSGTSPLLSRTPSLGPLATLQYQVEVSYDNQNPLECTGLSVFSCVCFFHVGGPSVAMLHFVTFPMVHLNQCGQFWEVLHHRFLVTVNPAGEKGTTTLCNNLSWAGLIF